MRERSKGTFGNILSLEQNGSEQHNPGCQREAFSFCCNGDALDGRWGSPVEHACSMQVEKRQLTLDCSLFSFLLGK